MTRQLPLAPISPRPVRPEPPETNYGWGKLVGAVVLGVAGALGFQLAGAITGLVLGAALGHWFDRQSGGEPEPLGPGPRDARDVAREAASLVAADAAEAFAALERDAGRSSARPAFVQFVRRNLGADAALAATGPSATTPWQPDVASACATVKERLDLEQRRALLVALYQHAHKLGLGAGAARLALRDGAAALGIDEEEETALRLSAATD